MKRLVIYLFIGVVLALMIYRFVERRSELAARTISQIQAEEGYPVTVATAAQAPFKLTRKFSGTVLGGEQTEVVSTIGEYIKAVKVAEGQWVEQGQVLVELSRDNPQAGYQRARLNLENAGREFERVSNLFTQGAVSQQALDRVTLARDMARDALTAAEKLLYVKAPFAGRVSELTAEVGGWAVPGMPLAKIVSQSKTRVRFKVPAQDRGALASGMPARVIADRRTAEGKISRIADSADPKARSFTAWVELKGKRRAAGFSPGLLVDIEIDLVNLPEALTVPSDALVRTGEEQSVYLVDAGHAVKRPVVLGGRNRDLAWVRNGVVAGDTVIVSGQNLLYDGAIVRIVGGR